MLTDEVRASSGIVRWITGFVVLVVMVFAANTINAPDAEFNQALIATATSRAAVFVPTLTPEGADTAIPPTPLQIVTPGVEDPQAAGEDNELVAAIVDTAPAGASGEDDAPAAAPPAQMVKHIIAGGDTLYAISVAYGVTVNEITELNTGLNPNYLMVGDEINIPVTDANRELVMTQGRGQMIAQVRTPDPAATLNGTPDGGGLDTGELPQNDDPTNRLGVFPVSSTTDPFFLTLTPFVRQYNLNDVPVNDFIVMPRDVLNNAREIFRIGLLKGRDPKAFSKMGDSTIENPLFMDRFDEGPYNLGDYGYLQPTIDWFRGSYHRDSVAVRVGFHSWSAFDPMWASRAECDSGEGALECEIRVHNPSFLFIRLGSNDLGVSKLFEDSMRKIIEYCIEEGVVPIIGTKGDRAEGSNINNEILRKLAEEYEVPLWDFDLLAATIPGRGLGEDGVHMNTWYAYDYTDPTAFRRGHGVHSLGALMMLDAIVNQIVLPETR